MSSIIKSTSLSHTQIMQDLKNSVLALDQGDQWLDWLESSTGQIIMRWMAGIATYKAYHEMVNRLESNLETARHETSVTELAFTRGFCNPPTQGCVLNVTFSATAPEVIQRGQLIGLIGKYEVYSLDDYSFTGLQVVKGVVGIKETITWEYTNLQPFTHKFLIPKYRYIATDLEQLVVNSTVVPLESDIDYLSTITDGFILRRITPTGIYLYVGNGILGWWTSGSASFEYTYICYDGDVSDHITTAFGSTITADLVEFTVDDYPGFGLTKEEIRRTSMYYPVDGRIVQEADYKNVLMKFFGGILHDVYSYNSDPNEEVYLLPDTQYDSSYQTQIEDLIDSKRELGMQVYYHLVPTADTTITLTRSSLSYDVLPNLIVDAIDNITQGATELTDYTISRVGFNFKNYSNRIYWGTGGPTAGTTYDVNYRDFGINWVVPFRVHRAYYTTELLAQVNAYLANKIFIFAGTDKVLTSVELAVELTREFDIPIYPLDESSVTLKAYSYFKSIVATITSYS